jgi:hypothetical protein
MREHILASPGQKRENQTPEVALVKQLLSADLTMEDIFNQKLSSELEANVISLYLSLNRARYSPSDTQILSNLRQVLSRIQLEKIPEECVYLDEVSEGGYGTFKHLRDLDLGYWLHGQTAYVFEAYLDQGREMIEIHIAHALDLVPKDKALKEQRKSFDN